MERWIVVKWDNRDPRGTETVAFEGSQEHCFQHARELLKALPIDMDCMAMSEKNWKWVKKLSG